MIRVTITDDHPLVREGIKKVLNNEIDIEICEETASAAELLASLKNTMPDIVVLDITMPGKSGLDLLKDLKSLHPDLPVLVLSIHPPDRFALRVLKAGAQGYLCKSSISKELMNAIRTIVNENRRYITPEVAELLAQQVHTKDNDKELHEALSNREYEVLCLIADGKDISTIADKLSLSPHTIHTYRSRIKDKMNLSTNVEMTRYALDNNLIN